MNDQDKIINNSDIMLQVGLPSDDKISLLKESQTLIGSLNPYYNSQKLEALVKNLVWVIW